MPAVAFSSSVVPSGAGGLCFFSTTLRTLISFVSDKTDLKKNKIRAGHDGCERFQQR